MSADNENYQELERAVRETRVHDAYRRRFIYSDVEALITQGFLYQNIDIGESTLVIRTLAGTDHSRMIARAAASRGNQDFSRWVIASSIWMIDGLDVTGDVNSPYHIMKEFLSGLRAEYLTSILSSVTALKRRTDRALRLVEAYCYEPYGRASWRLAGRVLSPGDNAVKCVWAAHNLTEDERQEDYRHWAHTRATVASMTSKGAKHLATAEERIKEREEQYRQKTIQDAVLWVYYGEDHEVSQGTPVLVTVNGQTVEVVHKKTAESREELQDEMDRWARGEKDLHDILVEEYLQNIRDRVNAQRAERQRAFEEAHAMHDDHGVSGGMTALVGYTPDQLEEMGVRPTKSTKKFSDSGESSYLFDRYIQSDIAMGGLDPSMQAVPITSSPEPVEPADEETLQEQIAKRRPSLAGLSEGDS